MTLCQNQQALGKPLFALLTVTILVMGGCSDKQDSQPAQPSQSSSESVPATPTQSESDIKPAATSDSQQQSPVNDDKPDESQNLKGQEEQSDAATTDMTAATSKPETTTEALSAEAGKELYEKQCKVCHESGLLNAPKYGDKTAWQPHISKGMPTLYEHSAKGFNKMPPQATNGVTEAQVHAAVDYMVAGSS